MSPTNDNQHVVKTQDMCEIMTCRCSEEPVFYNSVTASKRSNMIFKYPYLTINKNDAHSIFSTEWRMSGNTTMQTVCTMNLQRAALKLTMLSVICNKSQGNKQ